MTSETRRVVSAGRAEPTLVAYAWVWLPGQSEPVLAGRLNRTGRVLGREAVIEFTYSSRYRDRADAISLFPPELPLRRGQFAPDDHRPEADDWPGYTPQSGREPKALAGPLRDAAPDAWGRRAMAASQRGSADVDLGELDYLLGADTNRIGALDFTAGPEHTVRGLPATLDQLARFAEHVEAGELLPPDLVAAAGHGTSIGGARPKALVTDDDGAELIAKFASSTDHRPVVKAEAVGMLLADRLELDVPRVRMTRTDRGTDVLLVDRFDRGPGDTRHLMLSALTVLGLSEMGSWRASYVDLARAIRHPGWAGPTGVQLRELFTRMVLNIAVGNTDDHLRNHAALWDGHQLRLSPAFDVCPQPRSGESATHAIALTADGRRESQFRHAVAAAPEFNLRPAQARDIVETVKQTIHDHWAEVCDLARLSTAERDRMWGRQVLNPYTDYDQA